nr:hypothetical protein [Acidobacteriota bacterium]
RNGDVIGGFTVSSVNAQHPSFRRRQLSSAGCSAVQYFVNGVTGGGTEDASEGSGVRSAGVPPAGQLLVGCAGIVPAPTATPTPTGTLPPTATFTPTRTSTPVGPGGAGPSSPVPTLSETMLALFGLALAAAATLVLLTRKR